MAVPDHERAARYLSHINYYRLRAYWLPFENGGDGEHGFHPGTTFDSPLTLYIFDRKFRILVLEAIERVEVSLRTHFAYIIAMKYGSHAFMDRTIFRKPKYYDQLMTCLLDEIDRSQETFIEHYLNTYDDPALPPIWAVCEVMSFGQLSKWYKVLKFRQDRKAIAAPYGIDEKALGSFLHHLIHVRNFIAHHCRLWNRKLTVTMTLPKSPDPLVENLNHSPEAERRIYNTVAMLGYLLLLASPGTTWLKRMRQLIEEHADLDTEAMGFPASWQDLPMWSVAP